MIASWSSNASGVPSCPSTAVWTSLASMRDVPSIVMVRRARIGEYTAAKISPITVANSAPATAKPMFRLRARRVKRLTSARSNLRRSRAARRMSTRVAASGRAARRDAPRDVQRRRSRRFGSGVSRNVSRAMDTGGTATGPSATGRRTAPGARWPVGFGCADVRDVESRMRRGGGSLGFGSKPSGRFTG